jgi:signal peptidase I
VSDWGPWDSWEPPAPADEQPDEPTSQEGPTPPDEPTPQEDGPRRPTELEGDYGWGDYPEWPVSAPSSAYGQPSAHQTDYTASAPERRSHDPLGRLFPGIPRGARVALDWILTIVGAILIVFAVKHWVINPYRIPSSSMEPYLNCAKPGQGCLGTSSDRVLACRICLAFSNPSRGAVVVFNTPKAAQTDCGEGGTFVKRLIGLPGEHVKEDRHAAIWIRGPDSNAWQKLDEPYISAATRRQDKQTNPEFLDHVWSVPVGNYFFMGDNRSESCDSRRWGSVPRNDLIGTVFFTYWPPDRIGFK